MNDEHLEKLLREIDEEDDYAWLKETNAELREKIGILFNKNKQLETDNAALREDKARLDSGMIRLRAFSEWGNEWCIHSRVDLRAAIDAARAKEGQP